MVARQVLWAVIKKSIDYSTATYNAAYNEFSEFVSKNQTLESMEKNAAKYGFRLGSVRTSATRITTWWSTFPLHTMPMRWLFKG